MVTELLNLRLPGFRRSLADRWWRRHGAHGLVHEVVWGRILEAWLQGSVWSVNVLGDLEKRLRKAKELEGWRREPISDVSVGREAV